jgi:serine/threonine-protein kinase
VQRTLGDRYQLGEVLGQGGMAEVRKGLDTRLNRPVAVKMLRSDLARDHVFQSRFRREAQSAASLNAPSIVAVYDTGEDTLDGARVPYIVMEYVEGQTLRDLLRSGQRLLPSRALEIMDGVLAALDYSHRHGIVHRDVKPANVMLTPAGQVKVMDFGIARAVEDSAATMTQTANVLGTAQYLSPEQARGETVDARSDIYSAGCLLYELLTGRPPFQGESPVAVAYQHVREMPIAPSVQTPDIDAGVDAIVMKALAKNPENRYQSAAEMRDDIRRSELGATVAAPPVMAEPVTQPITAIAAAPVADDSRRRTGTYVALGLAAVAVLALFGFAAWAVFGGSGNKVRVPDVRQLPLAEATQLLEEKGLIVGQITPQANEAEKDTVLSQNPLPQAELEEGGAVDLTVSSGPEQVEVPTLVGLSQGDAITALNNAGLVLGDLKDRNSDTPAGQVLAAKPGEGSLVDEGSAVDLVVSTGLIRVPGVVGDTESQARATLVSVGGFDVVVIDQESATDTPGTVIAQTPTEGTPVRQGSVVTITVATEPPPTPTPTPTPTATATATATATP